MKDSKTDFSPKAILLLCLILAAFNTACILLKSAPDHLIGAAFCHQIPSRSPWQDFPFCCRCCGLFSGIFFGILSIIIFTEKKQYLPKRLIIAAVISFCVFLTDALNSSSFFPLHIYEESEAGRFLTAFPFGFFMSKTILNILRQFFTFEAGRFSGNFMNHSLFFLFSAGTACLLLFSDNRVFPVLFRLIACGGCCLILCSLFSILIRCFSILTNRPIGSRSVFLYALCLCFLQITIIGSLHLFLVQSGFLFPEFR